MSKAPFPIDPHLTGIAIAYRNRRMIADLVLPKVMVGKQEFKYWKYAIAEAFTLPDTHVGRQGRPAEVEFNATEEVSSTFNHALDDPIPFDDIANAPSQYNPVDRAVEGLTDLIELAREKRAADMVFALASYPSTQRVTLSGNDQWNSGHADSNPVADILLGLETPLVRPNQMVIGRGAWTALATNPKVVAALSTSGTSEGIARKQAVADLFELEDILIGESFINTTRKGQTPSYGRVWGKHCALLHQDRLAGPDQRSRVTFGYTAEWGSRQAGAQDDGNIGAKGGKRVRVVESTRELVVSAEAGYFLKDVAA